MQTGNCNVKMTSFTLVSLLTKQNNENVYIFCGLCKLFISSVHSNEVLNKRITYEDYTFLTMAERIVVGFGIDAYCNLNVMFTFLEM